MKGVTFRGHMDYVEEHVPGGVAAMLAAFKDRRLADFFGQTFLPSSFYDVVPLITAGYVCARLSGRTFPEFVRTRSVFQAERDINGLYRVLLKLASPSLVLPRLPALIAQYCNFCGGSEYELAGPGRALLKGARMPLMVIPWFNLVNESYIEVVLARAGAKNVRVFHEPEEPSGEMHGFPAARLRYEVRWE
jgi:hypothetical protein